MTFKHQIDVPNASGKGSKTVTFHLKNPADMPVGIMRRNRRNQDTAMLEMIEWALPAGELDDFDRVPISEVGELFVAWQGALSEPEQVDQDKPVGPPPKPRKKTRPAPDPVDDDEEDDEDEDDEQD